MEMAGAHMQALDACLRQATDSGTVPGAVVCVALRGQVVWQRAYGAAALTPEYRPMQYDTLFDIASLTKAVATTSLPLLPLFCVPTVCIPRGRPLVLPACDRQCTT